MIDGGEEGSGGGQVPEVFRKAFEAPRVEKEVPENARFSTEQRRAVEELLGRDGKKYEIGTLTAESVEELLNGVKVGWGEGFTPEDQARILAERFTDAEFAMKVGSQTNGRIFEQAYPDQADAMYEEVMADIPDVIPGAVGIQPSAAVLLGMLRYQDAHPGQGLFIPPADAEADSPTNYRLRTSTRTGDGKRVVMNVSHRKKDMRGGKLMPPEITFEIQPEKPDFPVLATRNYVPVVANSEIASKSPMPEARPEIVPGAQEIIARPHVTPNWQN